MAGCPGLHAGVSRASAARSRPAALRPAWSREGPAGVGGAVRRGPRLRRVSGLGGRPNPVWGNAGRDLRQPERINVDLAIHVGRRAVAQRSASGKCRSCNHRFPAKHPLANRRQCIRAAIPRQPQHRGRQVFRLHPPRVRCTIFWITPAVYK